MSKSPMIEVNQTNFARISASTVPVLLDFTAVWCAPCRAIAPHLEAIAVKYAGRLTVGKVDVDGEPELAARFDVRSMPTLLLLQGGQVIGQIVGAVPRARIEALVDRAVGAATSHASA